MNVEERILNGDYPPLDIRGTLFYRWLRQAGARALALVFVFIVLVFYCNKPAIGFPITAAKSGFINGSVFVSVLDPAKHKEAWQFSRRAGNNDPCWRVHMGGVLEKSSQSPRDIELRGELPSNVTARWDFPFRKIGGFPAFADSRWQQFTVNSENFAVTFHNSGFRRPDVGDVKMPLNFCPQSCLIEDYTCFQTNAANADSGAVRRNKFISGKIDGFVGGPKEATGRPPQGQGEQANKKRRSGNYEVMASLNPIDAGSDDSVSNTLSKAAAFLGTCIVFLFLAACVIWKGNR